MEIPFSTLSNKVLKTVFFAGSSKIFGKTSSKAFNKKTREKFLKICEVNQLFDQSKNSVSYDYYTPYNFS